MISSGLKSNFQKYVFKLKYLKEEFGELKFIAKKAELEINQKIRELQYELNVFDPLFDGVDNKGEKNFLHSSGSIDDHDVVLEVDPKIEHSKLIKKLYRSLAMKLHPDKWKNNITPEEREEAAAAADRRRDAVGDARGAAVRGRRRAQQQGPCLLLSPAPRRGC